MTLPFLNLILFRRLDSASSHAYFESEADAISEAEHTLRLLSGHKPALPVYIDLEDAKVAALSNAQIVQYTNLWLQRINAAGYKAGVYDCMIEASGSALRMIKSWVCPGDCSPGRVRCGLMIICW